MAQHVTGNREHLKRVLFSAVGDRGRFRLRGQVVEQRRAAPGRGGELVQLLMQLSDPDIAVLRLKPRSSLTGVEHAVALNQKVRRNVRRQPLPLHCPHCRPMNLLPSICQGRKKHKHQSRLQAIRAPFISLTPDPLPALRGATQPVS